MQKFFPDLAFVAVLLFLPLLLFAPVTLGHQTLLPVDVLYTFEPYADVAADFGVTRPQNGLLADLILENYPWKRFLVGSFQARRLPLWDPYLFTGHPFLASGQHSALYPLTWLFFVVPLARAFGLFIVVQLGLAGIWMYVLGRTMKVSRLGAFLAGVMFQFSGFLIVSVVHPMIVAAASWLPLLLALEDLTVRRHPFGGQPRALLPWALMGAVALGLQILAGHAEITYFVLLVMAMFAAWRLFHTALTSPRSCWPAEVLRPALGLLMMAGLGLALGAVQLIPYYEIVRQSFRQGAVTLEQVLGWAYPKRRLITFLVPNFFGNPAHHTLRNVFNGQLVHATLNAYGEAISSFDWGIKNYVEGGAYLGILPLFLAALAVLKPPRSEPENKAVRPGFLPAVGCWFRHPYVPFFTGLSLFSLGCIFGTPLYALVYALPFLDQSHSPFRWIFPLTVSVGALVALGTHQVTVFRHTHGPEAQTQAVKRHTHWLGRIVWLDTLPNPVSVLGSLAFWGGLLLLGGLWFSRLALVTSPLRAYVEPILDRVFWSLALASYAFPNPRAFYSYLFPWGQQAALFLVAAGIVLRVSRCPIYVPWRRQSGRRVPVWEVLAVVVLLVDLLAFGKGFNPAVDPALLEYTPPMVDFLRQDTGLWRFSTFDPHGAKTFNANVGMFYNFQDARGYDSLFTMQYKRYMSWIEPQNEVLYNRIAPFTQFSSLDSPLTDLLNVKYVISEVEIPLPKYKLVYHDPAVWIYENLGVMPRAFTLPLTATLMVSDVEAVGEAMQTRDPRMFAIVESGVQVARSLSSTLMIPQNPQPATAQPQTVGLYDPNQVSVDVTIGQPAWLVLTDAYFPGWKAFVRPWSMAEDVEEERPIVRVAGNFRGVLLEPGQWTVRFKYTPDSVKIGAFVSFLAGMTWLFLATLWFWRRAYRETGRETTVQRVAKNSLAPILLNLFNRAIDFARAALMLRILEPSDVGAYTYAINIFLWFEIFSNFGLDAYLMREVSRHREQAGRYLFNTTAVRLLLSVVGIPALVGFILLRNGIADPPLSSATIMAMALLYVGLVPGSVSKGLTALFYGNEKAEYPAAVTTLSTLLNATLGTLALLLGWGIVGLAGVSVVINVITLLVLAGVGWRLFAPSLRGALRIRKERAWRRDLGLRREMVKESWPLMLNHLMATLFFKVDIVLLEGVWGTTTVGWYGTAYKFLDALNVIPSMFTMAVFPVVSRQAQEDRGALVRFYRLGVKLLVTLALPVAVVTALLSRELVLILGDVAYLPHSMIALQLMIWSIPIGWINSLTNYVLIALDQQRYLTRAFVVGLMFNVIGNIIFMPLYGYRASAVVTVLSELALLIPFVIGVQKQVGSLGWWRIVGKPLLSALAMGVVTLALLPLGRAAALAGALVTYPLVAWRLKILTFDERAVLQPLLRRGR